MIYDKGSLIKRKDVRFKETGLLDTRTNGHPVAILLATDFGDDYVYFLTMSSDKKYWIKNPTRYLPVKNCRRTNKLKVPSYIDLKFIYKYPKSNIPEFGYFSDNDYFKVIDRLIGYQKTVELDPDFNDIENDLVAELEYRPN